jgi:drug/metabolite transporter (DMT)-like permease
LIKVNGFEGGILNKKRIFYSSAIIFSILLQAGSGICGKYAAITAKDASLFITVTNSFYFLSLMFLVFQAIVWQLALTHYQLSYAYPFVSLVNFVILIFSAILFQEQITAYNVLGLFFISAGIFILARSFGDDT